MFKMEDIKAQLKKAYDADAQRRINIEDKRVDWKVRLRDEFLKLCKSESRKTLLELGAGVGTDSKYFQDQGLKVLATDLSDEMIKKCREKGLEARVFDFYDLNKLDKKFDAIYSLNVLLHVPRKDLDIVLRSIYNALNPGGLFYYGVYGQITDKEQIITDNDKMGLPRFFSFLSDDSLFKAVKDLFDVIKFENVNLGSRQPEYHFQALFLRKKS